MRPRKGRPAGFGFRTWPAYPFIFGMQCLGLWQWSHLPPRGKKHAASSQECFPRGMNIIQIPTPGGTVAHAGLAVGKVIKLTFGTLLTLARQVAGGTHGTAATGWQNCGGTQRQVSWTYTQTPSGPKRVCANCSSSLSVTATPILAQQELCCLERSHGF